MWARVCDFARIEFDRTPQPFDICRDCTIIVAARQKEILGAKRQLMTETRRPRCFVAMAFDHDDTDALYEASIQPVLKSNSVIPIVINRREDNRDINNQIIEQLESCDFCIVDLTYTRPSVYFEAGYAQRAVDVIYTVRSDHLARNQPDDRRVHFDLQMKPLIRWTDPDDPGFRARLERRLRQTVLREWSGKQVSRQELETQRSQFSHLPLAERLSTLRTEGLKSLMEIGFTAWTPLRSPFHDGKAVSGPEILGLVRELNWILSTQLRRKRLQVVSLRVEESLTLKMLGDEVGHRLVSSNYPPHLDGYRLVDDRTRPTETLENHILASVRSLPRSRVVSAMPSLGWSDAANCYTSERTWTYDGRRWNAASRTSRKVKLTVLRRINVHCVDNIRSLPEFRESLGKIVEAMKKTQSG